MIVDLDLLNALWGRNAVIGDLRRSNTLRSPYFSYLYAASILSASSLLRAGHAAPARPSALPALQGSLVVSYPPFTQTTFFFLSSGD